MKLKLILLLLLIIAIAGAVYGGFRLGNSQQPTQVSESAKDSNPATNSTANSKDTALISGKLKLLAEDLNLFDFSAAFMSETPPVTKYYNGGTFNTGDFAGYTRIVAVQEPVGPGFPTTYIFATTDNKTYVVNGDPSNVKKYPANDYRSPYYLIDTAKVTQVAKLDTIRPESIKINDNFVLFKRDIPSEYVDTGKKDANGYAINTVAVTTDFSDYTKLSLEAFGLTFLSPAPYVNPYSKNLVGKEKTLNDISEKYTGGTTTVLVVDEAGLGVTYSLVSSKNLSTYETQKATQEYPSLPNLRFEKSQLTTNESLYNKYDTAFPGGCGGSYDTVIIKGVSDADLTKLGTLNGMPVYKLKDASHPLYELAYNRKVDLYENSFEFANEGVTKPTLAQYIAKNPLVFIKDPWDRLVALGEYDYNLPGGCGKPVVYLYPTKPTNVTVKFLADVTLTTQIPTYHNGWNVLAQPNGTLTDLQPEYTDCTAINTYHAGSEYAKQACATQTYPYIYWAGNLKYNSLPNVDEGWILSKNEVVDFLNTTLTGVGLNAAEKNDMLSFWLPKMLKEDAPYYKISFVQTQDMNKFVPMSINPMPDTVFRIFLTYQPLGSLPVTLPTAQKLNKLERNGFTVVEWGGLNRN